MQVVHVALLAMMVAGDIGYASTSETRAADPHCRFLYQQIDGDPVARAREIFHAEGPGRFAAIKTDGVPVPGFTQEDRYKVSGKAEEDIWKRSSFAIAIEINDADCLMFESDAWPWLARFNRGAMRLAKEKSANPAR